MVTLSVHVICDDRYGDTKCSRDSAEQGADLGVMMMIIITIIRQFN